MTQALRESINNVEIIGTLKKIDSIEEKVSKKGKEFISGKVTVEVIDGNRINNIQVRFFSNKLKQNGEINGIYKGYKTVQEEYKVGDKVRITGDLRLEEYYTQSGSLTSFNSVNALFFNRVEDDAEFRQKAIATLDMVIEGIQPKMDAEGFPTEFHDVQAFTVGYNSRVIPLQNLVINEQLAEQFSGMYYPGTTGKITLKINNYAEVEDVVESQEPVAGFGSAERVEQTVSNFTSDLEIIGGDLPYNDGVNEYSPEAIEQAHKNRALALQQLKESSTASAQPTGFGNAEAKSGLTEERKASINDAVNDVIDNISDNKPPFEPGAGVNVNEVPDF